MLRSIAYLTQAKLPAMGQVCGFARDKQGTTAVEFGLLAIPFFAIVGAIFETSIVFLASQFLDSAVHDSARLIRTGQVQAVSYTAAQFKTAICSGLYNFFDCNGLKVKVRVINDFSSAAAPTPVSQDAGTLGEWTIVEDYDPGGSSSIVMVEAYYKWPLFMNFGGFSLQNQPDGTRLLGSVRVFRNEPY